jgi:hypothetical protein
MPATCPSCNRDDQVEKVSVLVQSATSTRTFSDPTGAVSYSEGKRRAVARHSAPPGSSIAGLGRALLPPTEPKRPSGFGWWWALIILFFGSPVLVGLAAIVLAPLAFLVGAATTGGSPADAMDLAVYLFKIGCGFGVLGVAGIVLWYWAHRSKKKREQQKYVVSYPAWEKAMAKWKRLYFCPRDAIVFDPETQAICGMNSLQRFLYT